MQTLGSRLLATVRLPGDAVAWCALMAGLLPLVVLAVVVATVVWVYQDAVGHDRRGRPVVVVSARLEIATPTVWAVGCALFWIICFPLYLTARNQP